MCAVDESDAMCDMRHAAAYSGGLNIRACARKHRTGWCRDRVTSESERRAQGAPRQGEPRQASLTSPGPAQAHSEFTVAARWRPRSIAVAPHILLRADANRAHSVRSVHFQATRVHATLACTSSTRPIST